MAGEAEQPREGDSLAKLALRLGQRPTGTFDASEGMVKLDVVVTDTSGRPVSGLEPKDFTLLDNGRPEKIVAFHAFDGTTAKPDPPVEVIFLIDSINLADEQVSLAEQAVEKFLRRNGGHLAQPVSVYRLFNAGLSVTQQPSTDGNVLAEEMAHKNELRAILPQHDEPNLNADQLSQTVTHSYRNWISLNALGAMILEERRKPGRKLLFWISGGWPVAMGGQDSFDWITEFSTRLREARIELFSVNAWPSPDQDFHYLRFLAGVKSAKQAQPGNLALEVLATQSGGGVVDASDGLSGEIKKLAEDANAFYTISFDPPRTDWPDEYHELNVKIGKPGLEARTNSGYYDEPVYYDQPYLAERVTVKQLEQVLGAAHHRPDSELTEELSRMELTERMSATLLAQWKASLPGAKSQAVLVAVADASAFLNPLAATVPAIAPPDLAAQRQMLAKTIDYLSTTIPRLPNFFATRNTVRYRETTQKDDQMWKTALGNELLHSEAISAGTVYYRNGYDVLDAEAVKGKRPRKKERSMDTKGTFGPILSTVILDAAHGDLRWSRWEQGAAGVRAVFRYVVPKEQSHYELSYCCLTDGDGTSVFKLMPGYHGELMIDPETGAILRLTVEADLEPGLPLARSNIMVQYGPETIGGNTYICPVRSVSLWRGRRGVQVHEWGEGFRVYGPFETMLDDVSFGDYHMFRGEAHILPGYDPAPEGKQGDSGTGAAPAAEPKTEP